MQPGILADPGEVAILNWAPVSPSLGKQLAPRTEHRVVENREFSTESYMEQKKLVACLCAVVLLTLPLPHN